MSNTLARKSTVGHDQAQPAQEGPASGAPQNQAMNFITGKGAATSSVMVGLHQGLVDARLVHKLMAASRSGAKLAAGLQVAGKSLRQVVNEPGFDWDGGHVKGEGHGAAGAQEPAADTNGGGAEMGGAGGSASPGGPPAQVAGAAGGDHASVGAQGGEAHGAGGAETQGAVVARRASGDGIAQAHAQSVVDRVTSQSSGQPLDGGTRKEMEGHFGQSFAGVSVHTDAAAAGASKDLNAHAFTMGQDIYFGQGAFDPSSQGGKHLLAHELAHVAQGAGAAASASGQGVTISSPADAAEVAADRAADAVVRGEPVREVGAAPAASVRRDAIDDLDRAAQGGGSWTGSVDQGDVISRVRALSEADRRLLNAENHRNTMRHIAQGLDAAHMVTLFTLVPVEFRWRIYWLNEGGNLTRLNADQWQWLIGFASPNDMQALRQYPTGYRHYLQTAPANLIGAWDVLEGLAAGVTHPDATAVRNAVSRLSADQKAQLRTPARAAMVMAILNSVGDVEETFRTVTYIGFELKWSVYWINRAGKIANLTRQQWGQLLSEADKRQFDELGGWADLWALVQLHCDSGVIQAVRQQTNDPTQMGRSLDDQVQADALFTSLGPEGFLALATQADVAANYVKVKARSKLWPVLNGLRVGPRLGDHAKANLKKWFQDANEHDIPTLTKMFEVRFRVNATDTAAAKAKENATNTAGAATTNIVPWTDDGLHHAWTVCEMLPPDAVESNPRLMGILRNNANPTGAAGLVGNAYYWGASNNVVMGQLNGEGVTGNVDASQEVYWEFVKNPDGTWKLDANGKKIPKRDAMGNLVPAHGVQVNSFNATLRHEIGHAVDAALNVMEGGWRTRDVAGGWVKYSSYSAMADAIIADFGGLTNAAHCPAGKQGTWRTAIINTLTSNPAITFTAAVQALDATPGLVINDAGPASAIFVPARWTGGGTGPWYNQGAQKTGASGRRYQRGYDDSASLWSYLGATRDSRAVTQYQWRAPAEWFAEVYQVYYAEQENDPNAAVGGILRSRDAEAANMMSSIVDRGYSPQAMRGGTVGAAGTGTNTGVPR